jgi:hypothetical protein
VHTEFWWGNLREGDHFKDKGLGKGIILKWVLKESDVRGCTGLI